MSANSSCTCSVLKLRLSESRSLAEAIAVVALVAGRFQAVEQSRAALAQGVDHRVAGVSERQRDVFALFGQRAGDALRHFVDLFGDQIADRGDVVRQIEMDRADRLAHLFGLADQGVALVGQFAQQIADADFVVVIGAFERGDFVVDEGFQFGGARQSALDAVAHGGDFAADRPGRPRRSVRARRFPAAPGASPLRPSIPRPYACPASG